MKDIIKVLKAIIFDFDGVLVESVDIKGKSFMALYEEQGPDIQKQVFAYHNDNGGISRFEKIRYFEEKLLGQIADDKRVKLLAQKFGDIVERKVVECPWVEGAWEFLESWHQRISLFIASATPQEELQRIVAGRGAEHYFQEIFGAPIKKGEHIANILKSHSWNPDEVIMVGDAITDYDAARANDVPFIGRIPKKHPSPFPSGTKIVEDISGLARCAGLS